MTQSEDLEHLADPVVNFLLAKSQVTSRLGGPEDIPLHAGWSQVTCRLGWPEDPPLHAGWFGLRGYILGFLGYAVVSSPGSLKNGEPSIWWGKTESPSIS